VALTETVQTSNGLATVVFTDRADGDFRVAIDETEDKAERQRELAALRSSVIDAPWTWLRQVHGDRMVEVDHPGQWAGAEADGAITGVEHAPLAVTTADCSPVVMVSDGGLAVLHVGWKGIVAGIIPAAAALIAKYGEPVAVLHGPGITAGAYEFGRRDLDEVVAATDESVVGKTDAGTLGLDMRQAVRVATEAAGWPSPTDVGTCTSGTQWFSHRTRGDRGRQATVAWMSPAR